MSTPAAYSYIRFSTPEQMKGDSLRRQTEATEGWCQKNGVRLDEHTTLRDLGRSAYTGEHRKNPDRHALAAFLKLVEAGKIPRGSYLVIENLDRLTREDERKALRLWLDILDAGINIVQLSPETVFRHERSDMFDVMRAIMELSRGHGESRRKSELIGPAWRKKKEAARRGVVMTHRLPAWVEEKDGELHAVPDRAEVVREIFRLAGSGVGIPSILAKFDREKVPPMGRSGRWTRSYLNIILRDRRALGEYQPMRGKGKDGDVIPDYYPAVVTAAEWERARAGSNERMKNKGRGRVGVSQVNVFAGVLFHARDGDRYAMTQRLSRVPGKPVRKFPVLVNTLSEEGKGRAYSIAYRPFEAAVFSRLSELDPHEILNGDGGPDETVALAGQLGGVEASIALIEREMDEHGESPTLFRRLREKEERKKELARLLADARQRAASPLSEAWGETQSLLAAVDGSPDPREARLRLRSVLRRIVDSVWVLVVPHAAERRIAVQVWFTGGERQRSYLMLGRPRRKNAPPDEREEWPCVSFAGAGVSGKLDLRRRDHAARLEKALAKLDLSAPAPEEDPPA